MKVYNVVGYVTLILYAAACFWFAPAHLGPWLGLGTGMAYLIACWLLAGLYLSCVIHMGITHGALDYKEWFIKSITVVNNTIAIYINPVTWVNRHRLHHRFADHPGDPNKLAADGFWKTLYLCLFPYRSIENVAQDEILKSTTFRIVANPVFAVVVQTLSFVLLAWLLGSVGFAALLWVATRIFALWVNMVQNYWTHDRRYGYRRYDDRDNAMNISDWLPVSATFSACLQNNHHHHPGMLRLSHDDSEYDLGFIAVRIMKTMGLVTATKRGAELPDDVPLRSLNF